MPSRARNAPAAASAQRALSTGGYVVLGMLLDEPATGWELARAAERSIAHFWPITRAHIYAELPKLAERGWASATDVPQTGAPDKRVYTATDAGRAAFEQWLGAVELTEERGRQPLQLQLFFAAHGDPQRITALLDTWQQRAEQAEGHCADILTRKGVDVAALPRLGLVAPGGRSDAAPDPAPDPAPGPVPGNALAGLDARGMTALFGLRRAQADLVWVAEVRAASGLPPVTR